MGDVPVTAQPHPRPPVIIFPMPGVTTANDLLTDVDLRNESGIRSESGASIRMFQPPKPVSRFVFIAGMDGMAGESARGLLKLRNDLVRVLGRRLQILRMDGVLIVDLPLQIKAPDGVFVVIAATGGQERADRRRITKPAAVPTNDRRVVLFECRRVRAKRSGQQEIGDRVLSGEYSVRMIAAFAG